MATEETRDDDDDNIAVWATMQDIWLRRARPAISIGFSAQ